MSRKIQKPGTRKTQRGSADPSEEPRFLVVGRIVKPHGVQGEVRVEIHTDLPERFTWLDHIYLGLESPRPVDVDGVRFHKSWLLLKLRGVENRTEADSLRSVWLQIPEDEAIPLEENEYFLYQLIGLSVKSVDGETLGELVEVLETKANNVFVIRGPKGEILLPDIADVIVEIDFTNGQMIVSLLPGLVD